MIQLSKAKRKLFDVAARAALMSTREKFRHGAVLAHHNTVLSVGCNDLRPTKFGARFRSVELGQATVHAELGCILNMSREHTHNADVYVVRLNPRGKMRNSRPCDMCQAALRFVGVKRVFYSLDEDQFDVIKL